MSKFYRTFTFELHAGGVKLLEGQDLFSAFESFFQLAFMFKLEYGEKSQTVAEIIQLKIAKYGNSDKGTLTKRAKGTAKNKIKNFCNIVNWK